MKMTICKVVPRECSVLSSDDVEEKGWPDLVFSLFGRKRFSTYLFSVIGFRSFSFGFCLYSYVFLKTECNGILAFAPSDSMLIINIFCVYNISGWC